MSNSQKLSQIVAGGATPTVGNLKSATTVVDIASATAPSNGQVLTATDSTHATWQTPIGISTGKAIAMAMIFGG